MAVVPICNRLPYKDHIHTTHSSVKQPERGVGFEFSALPKGSRYLLSIWNDTPHRWQVLYPTADSFMRTKTRGGMLSSKGAIFNQGAFDLHNMTEVPDVNEYNQKEESLCLVWCASKSSSNKKQLRLLDSYFGKLQGGSSQTSSDSRNMKTELVIKSGQMNAKEGLESLNAYLDKLDKDANLENSSTFASQTIEENQIAKPFSVSTDHGRANQKKLKSFTGFRNKDVANVSKRYQSLMENDDISDLYLLSILASINIAVFLFEAASPIRTSYFEIFSLPSLYGAKINDLIIVGEWWRLVTPMFLHSGVFHVFLGCWSLLSFGPQVCKHYGSFTFLLTYILGGISGNLTSFLHTPEPTVGGTGPTFAIIGAWLIYQVQNKDVISKDVSEKMFQKAMIITAMSFILSHFGPIDDWTHLGAVFTGIVYGFLTCPTLQIDDASSRTSQDEGIALVRRYADPCKSLIVFAIFIIFLSSLFFLVEPPLDTIVPSDFIDR